MCCTSVDLQNNCLSHCQLEVSRIYVTKKSFCCTVIKIALTFTSLQSSSNGTWVLGVNSTIKWPKRDNFIYTIGGSNLTGLVANQTYSIA